MTKFGRQLRLNASFCAIDDLLESDRLRRNVENCARTNSAFSGTLWVNSHD
jgi:hypothetical protein